MAFLSKQPPPQDKDQLPFSLANALSGKLPTSEAEIVDGILGGILKTILVFGAFAVISGLQFAVEAHGSDPSLLTAILLSTSYILAYLAVALVTFLPGSTRNTKAVTLLLVLYLMGVLGLLESGLIGDGRLFFFGTIILTAVFYGFSATVLVALLCVASIATVGWASLTAQGPLLGIFDFSGPGDDAFSWMSASVVFLLVVSASVVAVTYLKGILVRSLEEARRAREEYRELYDQIPSLYFTVGPDLGIRSVNRFGAEQLGYDPEELVGQPILDLAAPMDEETMEAQLPSGEGSEMEVWKWEMRLRGKDGSEIWVAALARRRPQGATLLVCRDITRAKEMEQRYLQAQKMEMVGQLAGGVAHDFNNLLVPILGHADMALTHVPPGSPLLNHLDQIEQAADRAADLSRQLLSFSRRQITDPQRLDLNKIIDGMERLLSRIIGEDVQLQTHLEPELWAIWGGRSQMEQVIMNLAVNARDAMKAGGSLTLETANVRLDQTQARKCLGAQIPGPHVLLAVTDTGIGMTPELRKNVFDPFFTTKAEGEGTGLGLATVFGIVIQHKGSISVESAPGEGSRFEIYLPRMDSQEENANFEEEDVAESGSETVLVVEDDDMVRNVVCLTLESLGYRVLQANGPSACLAICKEHDDPIDLLLSDVIMPEMNGPELWDEVSRLRPETRVLFMSGYTRGAAMVGKEEGRDLPLLHKPFKAPALSQAIREVLDG